MLAANLAEQKLYLQISYNSMGITVGEVLEFSGLLCLDQQFTASHSKSTHLHIPPLQSPTDIPFGVQFCKSVFSELNEVRIIALLVGPAMYTNRDKSWVPQATSDSPPQYFQQSFHFRSCVALPNVFVIQVLNRHISTDHHTLTESHLHSKRLVLPADQLLEPQLKRSMLTIGKNRLDRMLS